MPGLFVLKSFILVFAVVIGMQGVAMADPFDPDHRRARGPCAADYRYNTKRRAPDMDPVLLGEILAGMMFLGVIGFLLLGFPVAFTLAGTSIILRLSGCISGCSTCRTFAPLRAIHRLHDQRGAGCGALFIFMGVMLERSNIAEQLLTTMGGCLATCAADWGSR
jgi:hypothetical protein